jgi:hypothetical protein
MDEVRTGGDKQPGDKEPFWRKMRENEEKKDRSMAGTLRCKLQRVNTSHSSTPSRPAARKPEVFVGSLWMDLFVFLFYIPVSILPLAWLWFLSSLRALGLGWCWVVIWGLLVVDRYKKSVVLQKIHDGVGIAPLRTIHEEFSQIGGVAGSIRIELRA